MEAFVHKRISVECQGLFPGIEEFAISRMTIFYPSQSKIGKYKTGAFLYAD
jgi:hypothetical protein